jgi:hypothetical protein
VKGTLEVFYSVCYMLLALACLPLQLSECAK